MNPLEAGAARGSLTPPEKCHGREALTQDEAMKIQLTLMHHMAPEHLHAYFGLNPKGELPLGVEDALFLHWIQKYAVLFTAYCDEHADDAALIQRLKSNSLTPEDMQVLETYLQAPEHAHAAESIGGLYFANEDEIDDVLRQYMH